MICRTTMPEHRELGFEHWLASVKEAARQARHSWLMLVSVAALVIFTSATITHLDLLFDTTVRLPIFQLEVPLVRYGMIAPLLLLAIHSVTLLRHYHLFRLFCAAPDTVDLGKIDVVLPNHHLLQAHLPRNGRTLRFLHGALHGGTLVLLPLSALLYLQIRFLPQHNL